MSDVYIGPAGRFFVVVRRGKELTFTEITATDADGRVVAHAVQTYRIVAGR